MRRGPVQVVFAAVLLVLLTLVVRGLLGSGSQPAAAGRDYFESGPLAFRYPASWHVYHHPVPLSTMSDLIAHLSTADLGNPCAVSLTECNQPFDRLAPDGLLVTWEDASFPGWSLARARGRRNTLGGHPAKVWMRAGSAGGCPRGTALSIQAAIPGPLVKSSMYSMRACLGPDDIRSGRRQVMAMLHSLKIHLRA